MGKIQGFVDKTFRYKGLRVKVYKGSGKVMENLLLRNYVHTAMIFKSSILEEKRHANYLFLFTLGLCIPMQSP